jgi:predicted small integral membrane protein
MQEHKIEGRMLMLRKVKILLVAIIALWGFLGALGNATDWSGTIAAVGSVTSMETFVEGATSWKATSNTAVIWVGALFIMLMKVATGVMCSIGALRMWQARDDDVMVFAEAKEAALTGFALAMIMLFGGFIVIAETWFELWRSDVMRGLVLDSAFRYGGMVTLVALFVAKNDS